MSSQKKDRKVRKLFSLAECDPSDIDYLVENAYKMKHSPMRSISQYAKNALLVLYFEKRSTRTRLSCTDAWVKMGGSVIDLSPQDGKSHINVNESLYDSFRVIADLAGCIVARVNKHETLLEIERAVQDSKGNPIVINGLSDKFHPLQILADVLTMFEDSVEKGIKVDALPEGHCSQILHGKTVTWIGDSNNVCNSLMSTLPRLGMTMHVCVPLQYPFRKEIMTLLESMEKEEKWIPGNVVWYSDPKQSLENAKYVITDTWVSMGDEEEKETRLKNFAGYQVNKELMEGSKVDQDWRFLHCLPRKKEEVSDEIFYSDRSLVFQEAENRMWTVLSVMMTMMTSSW